MAQSRRIHLIGVLLLLTLCTSIFWLKPFAATLTPTSAQGVHPAHAASSLPFHQYADGPYTVHGNQIIGADGKPYLFHGVGHDGLEFSCTGGGLNLDAAHLAYMGPGTSGAGGTYWFSNTVRLPLSEGLWLAGDSTQSCTAASYQSLVKQVVDTLTGMKLNVILDLQWTDAARQYNYGTGGGAGFELPDSDSVTFWQQAAAIYKSYSNVLFEVYNEPHPANPTNSKTSIWQCWQQGCQVADGDTLTNPPTILTYKGVGVQSLVNAVRSTGATNLVLIAGINWGFDLSQLSQFPITDSGKNLAYDTHPYPYSNKDTTQQWDAAFGYLTSSVPVMSTESGEYDCANTFMNTVLNYFDAHSMGWIGWAWIAIGPPCGYPQLITDYQGTPAASMGTLIYQRLLSYVPASSTDPISSTWYFAEGRAGAGFNEWLTLQNPSDAACTINIQYLAQPDGQPTWNKQVPVNVPAQTRVTEWVDGDLGTSPTGPGISDSAILTVNTSATPNCQGIVAERPMYFNALGTNSGSDVIGMTHLGKTFYFGDLATGNQPGGGSYASFLAILNPPGGQQATVTSTYYANGQQVTQQQLNVPAGSRGTIFPSQVSLPAHVAAVVTSTQPVAIERPTYFSNIHAGNAGTVSGAADVIGVQNLTNDWLFAEGYTGGQFQENFVIANVDPANATANVTITLEFSDGTTHNFTLSIAPSSQTTWNVNANAPGQSVSAEITSSGAKIVAEREMFFHYTHTNSSDGRSLSAMGGTDVLGQVGPVTSSNYSFAEGYTNIGYDEWLTIQNPTSNQETITITLVNGKGTVYTTSIPIGAHTRATEDITALVISNVYHTNDGFAGYEVSMLVQSNSGPFVAERPMYWNTSGTQGGSDAIGYTGG